MWFHLDCCTCQLVDCSCLPVSEGWIVLLEKDEWYFQICSSLKVVFCSHCQFVQIDCHQEQLLAQRLLASLNFYMLFTQCCSFSWGKTHVELVSSSVIIIIFLSIAVHQLFIKLQSFENSILHYVPRVKINTVKKIFLCSLLATVHS